MDEMCGFPFKWRFPSKRSVIPSRAILITIVALLAG
jgi:hypothetical protein